MVKTLMLILLMFSSLFSISTHPMMMGMILLVMNILLSTLSRLMIKSSWISLTMFLVMVGGIMIIFIYSTSISSNELFLKMNWNMFLINIFIMMILYKLNMWFFFNDSLSMNDNFNLESLKMYSPLYYKSTVFMFIFLLLVLFIIIKMMMMNKGPMRKKY